MTAAAPDVRELLPEADALIIVPPFLAIEQPSLAAHVLQACGRQAGFRVGLLYANVHLAAVLGKEAYFEVCIPSVCYPLELALLGERMFARAAHDLPPLGCWAEQMFDLSRILGDTKSTLMRNRNMVFSRKFQLGPDELIALEERAVRWADELGEAVAERKYAVVACTTTFVQTNASVALLKRIKRGSPGTATILGGGNCAGEMAEGIASLDSPRHFIDYVFSGEGEVGFPAFLKSVLAGNPPKDRILQGEACPNLDRIPAPDFSEFLTQRTRWISPQDPADPAAWIAYETSRGCWWGQKHHCTFCGIPGQYMENRQKSPDKVLADFRNLAAANPGRRVMMVDNLMPHTYFETLLPQMGREKFPLRLMYELKPMLSLAKMELLKQAGVNFIQAGIEALSTPLLKRMNKGNQVRQNLTFLRDALSLGIHVYWNLLWGLPGDQVEDYEQPLELAPLLHHLHPPDAVIPMNLDRFSPYFTRSAAYGVSNVRPINSYAAIFPAEARVAQLAYHFAADYESGSYRQPEVIRSLMQAVALWKKRWAGGRAAAPILNLTRSGDKFVLKDSRGLPGTEPEQVLDEEQARLAVAAMSYSETGGTRWALANKIAVHVDGWFVPLATAEPSLFHQLSDKP